MNGKGRAIYFLLLLAAAISMVFGPAPEAAAQTKPVQLVYASGYVKTHVQVGVLAEEWMKKIEQATQGRVKMRGVYGGTLLAAPDILDGLMKQTADAGSIVIGFTPGKLPLSSSLSATIDLNLGNKLDMRGIAALNNKLSEEFPEFMGEYQNLGVTPLLWVPTMPYAVISTKPIKSIADFYGKKIRTFGTYLPKLFEAAGAVPMAVSFGEIYTGLQTGVVDGAVTDPPAMGPAKFYEVAKYLTLTGPGWGAACALSPVAYLVNNKSFAQLSKADQDIVKKVSREMTLYGADLMTKTGSEAVADLEKRGVTVIRLPQGEVDKWAGKCPDWYALAAKDLDAKGLPGTKLMARYQELAKEYISGKWKPW